MKKIIPSLILLISLITVHGQTVIEANVITDTVWTKANSPYLVSSRISIAENVTLTIEPGVVIKCGSSGDVMQVDGTLSAQGTAEDPIVFTYISDDAYGGDSNNDGNATVPMGGDWGSIGVRETSAGTSVFQHCLFRYGGRYDGAIFADGSAPQISDCAFYQCKYGIEANGSVSPLIQNNLIEESELPLILSPGSDPSFSGNSLINNEIDGIALKANSHNTGGENFILKKINLAGITNIPYIVSVRLNIAAGTSLSIEPGVVIKNYRSSDMMQVDGTLLVLGTAEEPVVLTHISDDVYGGDSNNDGNATVPLGGDWGSIGVRETSAGTSVFQHCLFRYGGRYDGAIFADGSAPQISDCAFYQCKYGIEVNGSVSPLIQNNQIEESELPFILSPGSSPTLSGNSLVNNEIDGIALKANSHITGGENFILKKINLAGITNIPYIVSVRLNIAAGTSLSIEPGVVIKNYRSSDMMQVDGTLLVLGTAEEPVVFTHISDDAYGEDTNNDGNASIPAAGEWGSIHVRQTSGGNSGFQHCLFRFGGRSNGAIFADGSAPQISDCAFYNCKYGVEVNGTVSPLFQKILVEGSEIPLILSPGSDPVFSENSLVNNEIDGIALKANSHITGGENFILKKINVAGITNIPYIIAVRLSVAAGTSLSIEPGVVIKNYRSSDMMQVDGALLAQGSADEPVIFTHISDDAYGGDTNNDGNASIPATGEWGSIHVRLASGGSSDFEHCLFRFGGRYDGALFADGSSPAVNNVKIEYCKTGLEIFNPTGTSVKNLKISNSVTGLLSRIENGILQVDSAVFFQNNTAVLISSGQAEIHFSEFEENHPFDISNNTANAIDARSNTWDFPTIIEMVTGANPKNLAGLYDQFDDGSLGAIDYAGFVLTPDTIYSVSPKRGEIFKDTATVIIAAYPVWPETNVYLYNASNGAWIPDSVIYIDSLHLRTFWDFTKAEKGMYDLVLINGNDSITKSDGFALIEADSPFGEWFHFEVSDAYTFTSSVFLPPAERIYCLVKKATRVGYASTWKGDISIKGDEGNIANNENSRQDIELLLKNVKEGYYTYEIVSLVESNWEGYIKFCLEPDTIMLDEWNTGQILRPYGADWKVFELSEDLSELNFQTEGYGKWSSINVYYEFLGNEEQHWFFNNWGSGYNIQGVIQDPPKGKYYVKYTDSAVLLEEGVRKSDQTREYLLHVGTSKQAEAPQSEISDILLSSLAFGQRYSTLVIGGRGLSDSTQVKLYTNDATLLPDAVYFDSASNRIYADFDFSVADTGGYVLNLNNQVSDYTHPAEILVIDEQWRPIGIQVIGNQKYRVGRHQSVIIRITNNSNFNIRNGYVAVDIDNEQMSLNIEDPFYTPEFNAILNQVMEEKNVRRQFFFYSNLGPQEERYIHLKMYARAPDPNPIRLEVTAGAMNDLTYDRVFSLLYNYFWDMIKTIPFEPSMKDQINNYTYQEKVGIIDLVMDYYSLNRFTYMEDFQGKKNAAGKADGYERTRRQIRRTKTSGDVFRSVFGLALAGGSLADGNKWQVLGDMGSNGVSTILPAGLGEAFGGPMGLVQRIINMNLNAGLNISLALQGYEGSSQPEEEKPSRELEWFVWVKSTTPEDKYGPLGASVAVNDSISDHYINALDYFEYRIDYWNKEDATAPAAIVYIRDTLDADFDLSSFKFTEIGFLKWKAELEGGQYFNLNIDTRPDMPYIVNVEGSLDPETREVFWVHTTLDPETFKLTDDPLGGFLPPIDSTGYQLGYVSYTVQSKEGLPDSTAFTNQAFVNFDGVGKWGPAPKEGPFSNIFDFSSPASSVSEGPALSHIDSVQVKWSGTDTGSGVVDYTIFVAEGSAYSVWKEDLADTSAWFKGESGSSYSFYSIARDRVGNVEEKDAVAEYIVTFNINTISEDLKPANGFRIYPNPSRGTFIIENTENNDPVQIEVFNTVGKKLYTYEMTGQKSVLDLSEHRDGIYIIFIRSAGYTHTRKLIKQ